VDACQHTPRTSEFSDDFFRVKNLVSPRRTVQMVAM
jgi:hypothetical protein